MTVRIPNVACCAECDKTRELTISARCATCGSDAIDRSTNFKVIEYLERTVAAVQEQGR